MKRILPFLLIVFIVALLTIAGYLLYAQSKNTSSPTTTTTQPTNPVERVVTYLLHVQSKNTSSPTTTTTQPTNPVERVVITEKDNGKSFTFKKTTQAYLQLTNKLLWEEPKVSGGSIRLVQVNYFSDPGFNEWVIEPVSSGESVITSLGKPQCKSADCPSTEMNFEVSITVLK